MTYLSNMLTTSLGCSQFNTWVMEIPTDGFSTENPVIYAGVIVHLDEVANSSGSSARYARERAARKAVEALDGLSRSQFVSQYHCDCKQEKVAEMTASPEEVNAMGRMKPETV